VCPGTKETCWQFNITIARCTKRPHTCFANLRPSIPRSLFYASESSGSTVPRSFFYNDSTPLVSRCSLFLSWHLECWWKVGGYKGPTKLLVSSANPSILQGLISKTWSFLHCSIKVTSEANLPMDNDLFWMGTSNNIYDMNMLDLICQRSVKLAPDYLRDMSSAGNTCRMGYPATILSFLAVN